MMNRKLQIIKQTILLIFVAATMSCTNIVKTDDDKADRKSGSIKAETEESEKVAYIKLKLANSLARTVLPDIQLDDLTSLELKGSKNNEEEQTLGNWTSVSQMKAARIAISTGQWSFTLTAMAGGENGTHLRGTSQKEIALGENPLNFNLSISDDGSGEENSVGSFNITLNYAGAENASKVDYALATLENIDNNNTVVTGFNSPIRLTPSSNTITFTASNIPVGTYRARVRFYAESNQTDIADFEIASYRELVQISSGLTSSAERTIESFDQLYSITYHLNGGSLPDETTLQESFTRKSTIPLPDSTTLSRNYYNFAGWYTDSSFTNGNEISTVENITNNLELYAKWNPVTYTITYNLNGGTNAATNPTSYNIESNTITLVSPQKEGFAFSGWFVQENFNGTEQTEITAGSHEDKVYYAKWLKKCTVSFVSAHGTAPQNIVLIEGESLENSHLVKLEENGWNFCGWYSESTFVSSNKVRSGDAITDSLTLFAKWVKHSGPNEGFVFVEGGTVVGSDDYNQSKPYGTTYIGAFPAGRTVTLSNFYMSDHELTQGEYETYCCYTESTPDSSYGVGTNYPVYYVSWYDAVVYSNLKSIAEGLTPCYSLSGETDPKKWLGIKTIDGKYSCSYTYTNSTWDSITCDITANGYRLPTEAEWEYAARGGQETYGTTSFANYFATASTTNSSNSLNSDLESVGWYTNNSSNMTHEVKKKASNALGLYDMNGNVLEWCSDFFSNSVGTGNVTNPCGPLSGEFRIERGGSWDSENISCFTAFRNFLIPGNHYNDLGFRLVRTDCDLTMITLSSEHGNVPEHFYPPSTLSSSQLPTPNDDGWYFCGWYSDSSFSEESKVTDGFVVTEGLTLYAKWIEHTGPNDGFVFVEGGTIVGSEDYDNSEFKLESSGVFPAGRTVTLRSFYISDHELTQKEYEKFCYYQSSDAPSSDYGVGANYPAYNVSWYDAIVYSNLMSIREGLTPCYSLSGETNPRKWPGIKKSNGKCSCSYTSSNSTWNSITCDITANGYRLPTEAEWEYAARGGQKTYGTAAFTNYFSGANTINYMSKIDSALDKVGWYWYNICNNGVTNNSGASSSNSGYGTHEVKKKSPNALGVYDMSGNVWEWCWDWYNSSVDAGIETNPCGPSLGDERLLRGGCWHVAAFYSSVSHRFNIAPYRRNTNYGFRLVRSAQ